MRPREFEILCGFQAWTGHCDVGLDAMVRRRSIVNQRMAALGG